MFTFIHAADIHLDSPLIGLSKHADAPAEQIRLATRHALANLVDFAIEKNVDFLLIAGDLYDGDWKDYNTGLFFIREMRRLDAAGIPVFLISGNHDAESKLTKELNLPNNVHHFPSKRASSHALPTLPVQIHGQSFAQASVTENLAANYPAPAPNHFNIGLLHTNLGDRAGHGNYAPSTVPQLRDHGYDYWALGHIHQREVHHQSPHIVYSGNIQGRHAKETDAKGCYLVSVDDDLQIDSFDFHPLDTVRWHQLEIDCSPITDSQQLYREIRARFSQAIAESDERLAVVRLTLTGQTDLHGTLHTEPMRLDAECRSITEDLGLDAIWLEKIRIKTKSKINLDELAQRDDLISLVIDSLQHYDPASQPAAVADLLAKLPAPALEQIDTTAENLQQDVATIVLHAITSAE